MVLCKFIQSRCAKMPRNTGFRITMNHVHTACITHSLQLTAWTVPVYVHPHCTYGTCGVLHCLLFCDQTRPNLRISLVGYHCAIEFPCVVPLFYCCKYPTTYGVRVQYVYMYVPMIKYIAMPGELPFKTPCRPFFTSCSCDREYNIISFNFSLQA